MKLATDTGVVGDNITSVAGVLGTLDVTNAPPSDIRVEAEAPGEWDGLRDFALDGENRFTLLVGYGARDGEYAVRARPYVVNPYSGERLAGEWKELTFTLKRFTFDAEGSFGVAWESSSASYLLKADPEAGTTIGYYTIDIDNNGSFDIGYLLHDDELGGALEWEAPLPQAMLPADNGQYTSRVRVYSTQDYGWDEFDVPLSIGNMPARINIAAEHGVLPGGILSVSISTSDPGPDTVTSLTIDWGDGGSPVTITGNTAALDHLYEEAGDYTITVTATDEDGTYTAEHLLAVYVLQTPEPDWIQLVSSNATLSEDGLSATLEVQAISLVPGSSVTYEWDPLLDGNYFSSGATITLTRSSVYEPFRVALRVTDGAGHQAAWDIEFVGPGEPTKTPKPPAVANAGNYRPMFYIETPDAPADWKVRHTKQQALAERYLRERGINVHESVHLRAMPKAAHDEITYLQKQFWQRMATKYSKPGGVQYNSTTVKAVVSWDDIDKFEQDVERAYKDLWIEKGKNQGSKVKKILQTIDDPSKFTLKRQDRMRLIGISLTTLAIYELFVSKAEAAKAIVNHPPEARAAWDRVHSTMSACMDSEIQHGWIKREALVDFHAAFFDYCRALKISNGDNSWAAAEYLTKVKVYTTYESRIRD